MFGLVKFLLIDLDVLPTIVGDNKAELLRDRERLSGGNHLTYRCGMVSDSLIFIVI